MSSEENHGATEYFARLANRRSIVGGAVAVGAVIGVLAVVIDLWRQVGDVRISTGGWVAMTFGVLATLAVGVGLMALVFISNRRGFDEPVTIRVEPNERSMRPSHPSQFRPDKPDGATADRSR